VGAAARSFCLPHAARRFAAYSHAARSALRRLPQDFSGSTAIEYCMIACFISIVIAGVIPLISAHIEDFFTEVLAGFQ
jgi:Flp pilus assembly pilin Flp